MPCDGREDQDRAVKRSPSDVSPATSFPIEEIPGDEVPDRETVGALEEVEELKRRPDKKSYADFKELLEDLD